MTKRDFGRKTTTTSTRLLKKKCFKYSIHILTNACNCTPLHLHSCLFKSENLSRSRFIWLAYSMPTRQHFQIRKCFFNMLIQLYFTGYCRTYSSLISREVILATSNISSNMLNTKVVLLICCCSKL